MFDRLSPVWEDGMSGLLSPTLCAIAETWPAAKMKQL